MNAGLTGAVAAVGLPTVVRGVSLPRRQHQGTGVDGIRWLARAATAEPAVELVLRLLTPSQAVVDGGMARALSRQQLVADIRSATRWSQRLRGPCCVLPWCRAADPSQTPADTAGRRRPPGGPVAGRRPGSRPGVPDAQPLLAGPRWRRPPLRSGPGRLLAAGGPARADGRTGLLRPDPVVVRGLRRRPALDRALRPPVPLHRRHDGPDRRGAAPTAGHSAAAAGVCRGAGVLGPPGDRALPHAVRGLPLGPPGVQPGRQPPRAPCRVCRRAGSHGGGCVAGGAAPRRGVRAPQAGRPRRPHPGTRPERPRAGVGRCWQSPPCRRWPRRSSPRPRAVGPWT